MNVRHFTPVAFASVLAFVFAPPAVSDTLIGPNPYFGVADSPFDGQGFNYFHLEDFEDQVLDVPGVTVNEPVQITSLTFPTIVDSVDADDGVIDGSGSDGESLFFSSGSTGITFEFDAMLLGSLPTHAGIVWTDGAGNTVFEAFDAAGSMVGSIGPIAISGPTFNGQTNEDRFFGIEHAAGIASIRISNSSGGIEVDHLQYGLSAGADTDGDGIDDATDNCTTTANANQIDIDGDGYGNACDADFNNDCLINFVDLSLFSGAFLGADLLFDINGDGAINFLDLSFVTQQFLGAPGPGLGAC
ncbi:MAG: thrombospondin type 3 repeat-containing protein [Pseudomonadota bacterium]